MTAALDLARQGFEVHLVEKEGRLGGNLRNVHYLLGDGDPQAHLAATIEQVRSHPGAHLHMSSSVTEVGGFFGNFRSTITNGDGEEAIEHGVIIVATGAQQRPPTEYFYGEDERVLTQNDLEKKLASADAGVLAAR